MSLLSVLFSDCPVKEEKGDELWLIELDISEL